MGLRTRDKVAEAVSPAPTLKTVPFLKDAPAKALKLAEKDTRYFGLPGGWKLFDVGEPSDSIYFVLSGSLGAFRKGSDGQLELLGHIRAGEPVGEMSMIAGEPHEHTVYALRDTELLSMSRAGFMQLVRSDPEILERLTRVIMVRMRQSRKKVTRSAEPRVFGLIATSATIDLKLRSKALAQALQSMGLRVAIVGEEAVGMPVSYFDELETRNDIVLLVASIGDTPWFRLTQRHSDRLWLFARSDARPSSPLLPQDSSPVRQFRLVDVVLLHHAAEREVAGPEVWKAASDAARVFHWSGMDPADCRRLARIIAGKSVGLVLSGGGARAYAHIGAVRALREANCPIDFIGGASMGAIVAAAVACGWDDAEIDRRIRKAFVETNPLSDYMLPVVSLVKGHKVDARLKEHFDDLMIENLSIPFFAVSTNLTQGTYRVHASGLLRDALRASVALPGILPPIVADNQVLVDGAVLNNFPVDVMRDAQRGRIIGVDVAQAPEGLAPDEFRHPPSFFGWTAQRGFSAAPPIANLLMRAATVSVNPNAHRDLTDMLVVPEMEGVELRDWKDYERAVAAGYEATRKALDELKGPLAAIIRSSSATAAD
ncbi:MAG: cyclic nucleotide-binding domain-containing protein [Alphaproteobacteria bacterium]|nr:cyclic nucleotide-binding domain-containing protein [Alphaproteobacteria bacterium]